MLLVQLDAVNVELSVSTFLSVTLIHLSTVRGCCGEILVTKPNKNLIWEKIHRKCVLLEIKMGDRKFNTHSV